MYSLVFRARKSAVLILVVFCMSGCCIAQNTVTAYVVVMFNVFICISLSSVAVLQICIFCVFCLSISYCDIISSIIVHPNTAKTYEPLCNINTNSTATRYTLSSDHSYNKPNTSKWQEALM